MNVFAPLKLSDPMNDDLNFQTVYGAAISLIIMKTGSNFFEQSNAAMRQPSINFDCIQNPTYDDLIWTPEGKYQTVGCGDSSASILIFFSFAVLIPLIFINVFIALILQGYSEQMLQNNKLFNSELCEKFRETWSYFDQEASGLISVEQFPDFMQKLGPPLGWRQELSNKKDGNPFLRKFTARKMVKDKYCFTNILEELVMIAVINEELLKYVNENQANNSGSITSGLNENRKKISQQVALAFQKDEGIMEEIEQRLSSPVNINREKNIEFKLDKVESDSLKKGENQNEEIKQQEMSDEEQKNEENVLNFYTSKYQSNEVEYFN